MKVYEVIRVINLKVLFLSEHLDRFKNSILHYKNVPLSMNTIYSSIFNIINNSEDKNFNIKMCFDIDTLNYSFEKKYFDYPTLKMYKNGISIKTFDFVFENPNIKIERVNFRKEVDKIKKRNNAHEILFVNNYKVYECSSSNIFFIKNNKIYTSKDEDVLMGVTRRKVFEICSNLGIEIIKVDLYLKDINKMNSAFITSTSRNILPVNKINLKKYNTNNKILKKLILEFEKLINDTI